MTDLFCPDEARRDRFRAATGTLPHAIDHVEVLPSRRALLIHTFADLPPTLGPEHIVIEGGVRITSVRVTAAARADLLPPGTLDVPDQLVVDALSLPGRAFAARTDSSGDFSTYVVRFVPPSGIAASFDPILSSAGFSFKVDCASDFDCRQDEVCSPEERETPRIDYLAKDYASFRRAMLDRLGQTVPDWSDRGPVDTGITLVEAIAYVGDLLSYQQDAAATEAYLGTARLRSSVRRHARLLDYPFHDGANARTWIAVTVGAGSDGTIIDAGTRLVPAGGLSGTGARALEEAAAQGVPIFETLHPLAVKTARNEIQIHTWGDPACCLPRGATTATLRGTAATLGLVRGDVLLLEELRGFDGRPANADPRHRHVVRLAQDPVAGHDPLEAVDVLGIRWHDDDALPFALTVGDGDGGPRAVVRGNVILADHGLTIADPPLTVPTEGRFRPQVTHGPVTQAMPFDASDARRRPASQALATDALATLPRLWFQGEGLEWQPRRDLLASDAFAPDFVYEMEDDGRGRVRFGDDMHGRRPTELETFTLGYRIGTGPAGNVGHDTLVRALGIAADIAVRNPMPAVGGHAPEATEHARLHAPQAFRRQERAVTEADYATVAERHPEVQRAAATRRWTGSWHTMYLTVDRRGGLDVDADFEARLRGHLDRFRMAGYDLEVDGPRWVPLDLVLRVCVAPGYIRSDVERAVRAELSARDLPDGRRGAFHPDLFTFGQPVYLAPIVARAMSVAGVLGVDAVRFGRWREEAAGELAAGRLTIDRLEIARLDDDPSRPEFGHLTLQLEGGS